MYLWLNFFLGANFSELLRQEELVAHGFHPVSADWEVRLDFDIFP